MQEAIEIIKLLLSSSPFMALMVIFLILLISGGVGFYFYTKFFLLEIRSERIDFSKFLQKLSEFMGEISANLKQNNVEMQGLRKDNNDFKEIIGRCRFNSR